MLVKLCIVIAKDNYAYLSIIGDDRDSKEKLYKSLCKSYTREVSRYNNYFKMYEKIRERHYESFVGCIDSDGFSLIRKCDKKKLNGDKSHSVTTILKVKAGTIKFLTNSLSKQGIEYIIQDQRSYFVKPDGFSVVSRLDDKVTLRDYQIDAVNAVYNSDGFCCVQIPTGGGKTECAASIIKTYMAYTEDMNKQSIVYVVPTIRLLNEAKSRFKKYDIPCDSETCLKENSFRRGYVNLVTYMFFARRDISQEEYNSISVVLWDEMHHLKAPKSSQIVHNMSNLVLNVGLSATISADIEYKKYLKKLVSDDFNKFGSTGYPIYVKRIVETIEEGSVLPIKVHVLENNEQIKLDGDDAQDWHKIRKAVLQSPGRGELVASLIKHIVQNEKLNTICLLIPEIEWSHNFMLQVAESLKGTPYYKEAQIILTYGGNKYDIIENGQLVTVYDEEYKVKLDENIHNPDKLTIFSCTSYAYEGIDITNMQAIVNVYGGRSDTRVKQQAGRVMRLFSDKDVANIYEIYDKNNPILAQQFKIRLGIYTKSYDAEVSQVTLDDMI